LVNRYSFSGAEDVEFIFAINKWQLTNNYSAIRASGVPINFERRAFKEIGFIDSFEVWSQNL